MDYPLAPWLEPCREISDRTPSLLLSPAIIVFSLGRRLPPVLGLSLRASAFPGWSHSGSSGLGGCVYGPEASHSPPSGHSSLGTVSVSI